MLSKSENKVNSNESDLQGNVFDIERFAINDGPGIRTIVFLTGCPLRCLWCANPESQKPDPKLMYWEKRCLGCKQCIKVCEPGALSWDNGIKLDRSKCTLCGKCAEACNSEALTIVGKKMSVTDVFKQVNKDAAFYEISDGGITFSGGEAFAQPRFLLALAKEAKVQGYHTCVETTGYVEWDILRDIMPYIDIFLYDIKCMDNELHKTITGVGNELILKNYLRLLEYGKKTVVRFPLIPTKTDSDDNILKIIEFVKNHNPCGRIDILPYHRLGISKYDRLGMAYNLVDILPPTAERTEEIRKLFEDNGFNVLVGG